jgi:hypothetical protein
MSALPPCGLYATTAPVGSIGAGRLVYFHNHGNPGPGLYLPSSWQGNRARFEARGHLLATPQDAASLEPLAAEGFYRVLEPFHCCDKQCKRFEPDTLVQLGYDAAARPILFVPQIAEGVLTLPSTGTRIDLDRLAHLAKLGVAMVDTPLHDGETSDSTLLH